MTQDRTKTQPFSTVVAAAKGLLAAEVVGAAEVVEEDAATVVVLGMVSQGEEVAMGKIVDHLHKMNPKSVKSMDALKNGVECVDIGPGEQLTPTHPTSAHTVNSKQQISQDRLLRHLWQLMVLQKLTRDPVVTTRKVNVSTLQEFRPCILLKPACHTVVVASERFRCYLHDYNSGLQSSEGSRGKLKFYFEMHGHVLGTFNCENISPDSLWCENFQKGLEQFTFYSNRVDKSSNNLARCAIEIYSHMLATSGRNVLEIDFFG